jgi:hypothetical protein
MTIHEIVGYGFLFVIAIGTVDRVVSWWEQKRNESNSGTD